MIMFNLILLPLVLFLVVSVSVSATEKTLPAGLVNQTAEESEYLSFHICIGGGEAYGAAYLITKEHLLLQFTDLPLNWVNCELASFMMMTQKRSLKPNHNGQIIQSLDVLDFSAIHLSAYERLTRRKQYKMFYKKTPADTIEVYIENSVYVVVN